MERCKETSILVIYTFAHKIVKAVHTALSCHLKHNIRNGAVDDESFKYLNSPYFQLRIWMVLVEKDLKCTKVCWWPC